MGGSDLNNSKEVALSLRIKSVRIIEKLLDMLKLKLTEEEKSLLLSYGEGKFFPDSTDFFPEFFFTPNLKGANGKMLELGNLENLSIYEADRKKIYRGCVKVLNVQFLKERVDTVWREKLGLDDTVQTVWRVFYKPPLEKRMGDLQWRILHGAFAVNAFVNVINSDVSQGCPVCKKKETIFHCFMECTRLNDVFSCLNILFNDLGEIFNIQSFIIGYRYSAEKKSKMSTFKLYCWCRKNGNIY